MIGPSGPPGGAEPKRKKSKSDREAELRALDKDLRGTSGAGVDYSKVSDRHVDDSRFERELAAPPPNSGGDRSAAFDAFMRLQTGQGERTIEDKINDKNRPTWEQYKKENEDKLDLKGAELKKMQQYRAELDAVREAELQRREVAKGPKVKTDAAISDEIVFQARSKTLDAARRYSSGTE